MKRVALIVEGHGDVQSAPALVARAASTFGLTLIPADPIRAGEAPKLRRHGELERFLRLAASRPEIDEIFVVLDMDDGCAKEYHDDFVARTSSIAAVLAKPVHFCFCVREYEGWFLSDIETLRLALPEYGISAGVTIENAESIRGAKQLLNKHCRGRVYKETRDQVIFTRNLDIKRLARRSRSFRKLLKAVTGMDYGDLALACAEA